MLMLQAACVFKGEACKGNCVHGLRRAAWAIDERSGEHILSGRRGKPAGAGAIRGNRRSDIEEKASRKKAKRRRRGINCRRCGSSEVDVEGVVDESFVVEER